MPKILRPHLDQEQQLSKDYVQQKLTTGRWGRRINTDKQRPHNELTRAPGKSYLLASVDAQELFDKYAGTGKLRKNFDGSYSNKELVVSDHPVGYAVQRLTREEFLTNTFYIHHSKTRTHVVPKYNSLM